MVETLPPPPGLHASIAAQIARATESLPTDARGAVVALATRTPTGAINYNLAVVVREGPGFSVTGYIAKAWDQAAPEVGGEVRWSW